jgi:hypothetical protein
VQKAGLPYGKEQQRNLVKWLQNNPQQAWKALQ